MAAVVVDSVAYWLVRLQTQIQIAGRLYVYMQITQLTFYTAHYTVLTHKFQPKYLYNAKTKNMKNKNCI